MSELWTRVSELRTYYPTLHFIEPYVISEFPSVHFTATYFFPCDLWICYYFKFFFIYVI